MRTISIWSVVACLFAVAGSTNVFAGAHRIGGGAHYWQTVNDVDLDNVDEDGIAWLATYQYKWSDWVAVQTDLEFLPENYAGSDKTVLAPQAYLTVGSGLYGGVGVGILYSDGDFADKPFFALRAGVEMHVLPSLYLDINANYRFEEWESINQFEEDISEDTITLGAALRLELP